MSAPIGPIDYAGGDPADLGRQNPDGSPAAFLAQIVSQSPRAQSMREGDVIGPEGFSREDRRKRGRAEKPTSSRAQQLEALRGAPQWAQPGRQMSAPEGPSQEDMLYYLINNSPRNTSKFVNAFGKNAAGEAMAGQMSEYEGMPTGVSYPPDEAMNATFDDPMLQDMLNPFAEEAAQLVPLLMQQRNAAQPDMKPSGDSYKDQILNWVIDRINRR